LLYSVTVITTIGEWFLPLALNRDARYHD
jgi:hypothetical protein